MTNDFNNIQLQITELRTRRAALNKELLGGQHQLTKNSYLSRRPSLKNARTEDLERQNYTLKTDLKTLRDELKDINKKEAALVKELA